MYRRVSMKLFHIWCFWFQINTTVQPHPPGDNFLGFRLASLLSLISLFDKFLACTYLSCRTFELEKNKTYVNAQLIYYERYISLTFLSHLSHFAIFFEYEFCIFLLLVWFLSSLWFFESIQKLELQLNLEIDGNCSIGIFEVGGWRLKEFQ